MSYHYTTPVGWIGVIIAGRRGQRKPLRRMDSGFCRFAKDGRRIAPVSRIARLLTAAEMV